MDKERTDNLPAVATAPAAERHALVPKNLDELWRMAKPAVLMSGMTPDPENVARMAGIMQIALEVGLPIMRAPALMDPIPKQDGGFQIRLRSEALRALVMASPQCEWLRIRELRTEKGTIRAVVCTGKRRGDPEICERRVDASEFAAKIKNAKPGSPWKSESTLRRMLSARASGYVAADLFPDVCAGLVTESWEPIDGGAIDVTETVEPVAAAQPPPREPEPEKVPPKRSQKRKSGSKKSAPQKLAPEDQDTAEPPPSDDPEPEDTAPDEDDTCPWDELEG